MFRITTTHSYFNLKTYPPRAHIEQRVGQFVMKTSGPRIEIDARQSRNELGIGGYQYMSRQIREKSYEKTMAAIAQMAQEGDEVVNRAGHFREEMIFTDISRRRMDEKIPELNITAAPQTRPEIRFYYEQEIAWDQGGAFITHQIRPPELTWHLGDVKVEYLG
ncbi:MAG: hypothetical protein GX956_02360 [Firmicutes bacterium]|nr:hypothetical protein [Bacillota bacterium]